MSKLFKILATIILGVTAISAHAQQPQTQTAPISALNAKYTNGVAPGYWPTAGSGLVLNISGGTSFCSGTVVQYNGGTLTLAASATNFVYLNTGSSCTPASKTSALVAADIPVAEVVTGSSSISSIIDIRTQFSTGSATLASTTLCNTGTVATGNAAAAFPANGIAPSGAANCPAQIVEPKSSGLTNAPSGTLWVNSMWGQRHAWSYNPQGYNGAATTVSFGAGLGNSLADCYNNAPYVTIPIVSSASKVFIVPCYVIMDPQYQYFGDSGASGSSGSSSLNAQFYPPSYRDPNILTNGQWSHGSFINYNNDMIQESYFNPGVCAWPLVTGTSISNCASENSATRIFKIDYTNPVYAAGSNGNKNGVGVILNDLDGSYNQTTPNGPYITNIDPMHVTINANIQSQMGVYSATGNHPAGGDNFIFRITGTYGGYSSGSDQGGGVLWGVNGESKWVYTFTSSSTGGFPKQQTATTYSAAQLLVVAASTDPNFKDGEAAGPNHFAVDSSLTYTTGNVSIINVNPSITVSCASGVCLGSGYSGPPYTGTTGAPPTYSAADSNIFEITGTSAASWVSGLGLGTTGNYIVQTYDGNNTANQYLPSMSQSPIATNASGGGAAYGCVPYGTSGGAVFGSGSSVNGNPIPTYPAPAVCYVFPTISSGALSALTTDGYVQITDGNCSETSKVIYADVNHVVASAACPHSQGTVIYWGPATGLAINMGFDSIPASETNGDQIDEWRQVAGADNAGDIFVMDFLPKGGVNPYVNGTAYLNTTHDVQPVCGAGCVPSLSGSAVSITAPATAGKYVSDTNNTSGNPHLLTGTPLTITGGTCTTSPTAVLTASYNSSNYFVANGVQMTNVGNCSSVSGMTVTVPITETANPYVIAPAANVAGILSNFNSGNINSYGLRLTPNPYSDGTYNTSPFGSGNSFASGHVIQEAHLLQMDVNFDTQFVGRQFGSTNSITGYSNVKYKGYPKSVFGVTYEQDWENFYVLPKSTVIPNPFPLYLGGTTPSFLPGNVTKMASAYDVTGPFTSLFSYSSQLLSGASGEGQAFVGRCGNTNVDDLNLFPCWQHYYAPFYQGGFFDSIDGSQSGYYGTEYDITNNAVNFYAGQTSQGSTTGEEMIVYGPANGSTPDTVKVLHTLLVASGNCIGCSLHTDSWTIPPALLATSSRISQVFCEPNPVKIVAVTASLDGTISCSVAPTVVILDLGTSPSTAYGSATILKSLTTGTSDGAFASTGLTISVTAGHFLGVGLSAGTCSTAPNVSVTVSAQQ